MRKKILILEPQPLVVELLSRTLHQYGYVLDTAADGMSAQKKIKDFEPGLILLSAELPLFDEAAFKAAIARPDGRPPLPVIGVLQQETADAIELLERCGATDRVATGQLDGPTLTAKIESLIMAKMAEERKTDPFYLAHAKKILKGKTLLVVEDEVMLQELIMKSLEKEGCRVITAADGEAALKLIKESKPQLVVMDIVMPIKDGFEVMTELRQAEILPRLPIIIFSNLNRQEDIDKGLNLGAKAFLVKSSATPAELVEVIRDVLMQAEAEAANHLFF